VEYVNVKDSYASSTITASNSTNVGNNTNWEFVTSGEPEPEGVMYDRIVIDHDNIAEDLTNFPVYIDLSDLSAQFWNNVHEDGGNIRIFTDDLSAELPREVVSIS